MRLHPFRQAERTLCEKFSIGVILLVTVPGERCFAAGMESARQGSSPWNKPRLALVKISTGKNEEIPMRGILLWLIGIPIPVIIILWLLGFLS